MMSFESKVIENTVCKLINGQDYRSEVVNAINVQFLDFSVKFFKEIIQAKLEDKEMNLIDFYFARLKYLQQKYYYLLQ